MQKRDCMQDNCERVLKKVVKLNNERQWQRKVSEMHYLMKEFKYLESIQCLKCLLIKIKGKTRQKGGQLLLLLYLVYKQLGVLNLELSLNNDAIKYLLKA